MKKNLFSCKMCFFFLKTVKELSTFDIFFKTDFLFVLFAFVLFCFFMLVFDLFCFVGKINFVLNILWVG